MSNPFMTMAGKAPVLESVRTVALYDPHTGRIVHQHSEFTFTGGKRPHDEEIVTKAFAHASRRHADPKSLAVAVSDSPEHASSLHRIDLETKAFVPIAAGTATSRSAAPK